MEHSFSCMILEDGQLTLEFPVTCHRREIGYSVMKSLTNLKGTYVWEMVVQWKHLGQETSINMAFEVNKPKKVVMYNGLFVSKFSCNLFSVRVAGTKGSTIKFRYAKCWI